MKCKVCGHRANTLAAMSAHYRKKHPAKMVRHGHAHKLRVKNNIVSGKIMGYCPFCGNRVA